MVSFNDLSKVQAIDSHKFLGGDPGVLRSNRKGRVSTTAIVNRSVKIPSSDGMGIQTVITASFLYCDVGDLKKGDCFVLSESGECLTVSSIDDNDGHIISAFVRSDR